MSLPVLPRRLPLLLCVLFFAALAPRAQAGVIVDFSKAFAPSTIGPGSTSKLTFTLTNTSSSTPAANMTFVDNLPAGVVIATPASAVTNCGAALLDAPAGGTTISLSNGSLGIGATCTVRVNVTAAAAGSYMNVSGNLTSTLGLTGPATATLTVSGARPGFAKSFSPSSVLEGDLSTLTFTIDNSLGAVNLINGTFTDVLPAGVVVAPLPNGVSSCPLFTAVPTPGANSISSFGGFLSPAQVCTISVDVLAVSAGVRDNVTTDLDTSAGISGFATARLVVNRPAFTKSFTNDPVPPGALVTLRFEIRNLDRLEALTGITFTDDLGATLTGLVAVGLPANDVCGSGSQLTGTGLLTLTGGNLPPEGSCAFNVVVQVPAGAAPGSYPNATSTLTAMLAGSPFIAEAATDTLVVQPVPMLTKEFVGDPVAPGGMVTLRFTILNTDLTGSATNITFTDDLATVVPGMTIGLPAAGFCGAGSTATLTAPFAPPPQLLSIQGANLAAGASCSFDIALTLPPDASNGTFPNTTSGVTATVQGNTVLGAPASDDLVVIAAPTLSKDFTDDPVAPGSTVTLEFTLSLGAEAPGTATNVSFMDDLNAVLMGLTAVGLPANDICGMGSQLAGTTLLTLSGATLNPGESCTFSVTLQVPAMAAPGTYTNTSSSVTATVLGQPVVSVPASDLLVVRAPSLALTKSFIDDPAVAGGTATLEFTLSNASTTATVTNIAFTDDLASTLSGLTATGLPMNDVCGMGSQLAGVSGNTMLVFTGGTLGPSASCTFSVTLQIPAAAANGQYPNVTSQVSAQVDTVATTFPRAADTLLIVEALSLTKQFTDDPVVAGDTVTLEFTITNADGTTPITGIAFTDDLNAALSGLVATGLPVNGVCGAGSQISGTSLLAFTGGSLPAASSCTFSVTLQVPAGVPFGTMALNTTSSITGSLGGTAVTGTPASDVLRVASLGFSKAFSGPAVATGTVNLVFTIQNLSGSVTVSDIGFTDNLSLVLPGLVAIGLPANNVCGAGSQLSGTSFLTLTGGTLLPNASCTIVVTLQVPAAAAPGSYLNTSSDLFVSGLSVAEPATASLTIEPPPTFAKSFNPASVGLGFTSTLAFAINNTASALVANNLSFTDNLPAGVTVAAAPNAMTTCTGGTITALPASGLVSYSGGSVAAGASCIVQVDVTAGSVGSLVNTSGDLTSSSGNSGPATATLVVNPPPGFAKAFAPATIVAGGISTLTFTIDNSASTVAATGFAFSDNLPNTMVVAPTPNASNTCAAGMASATPGSGTFSFTGGTVNAGATCTVQVDVTGGLPGANVNTSGDLTSSLGNSGPASATLTVNPPPAFSKAFAPSTITAGGISTLTLTIDNSASTVAATGLDFTDNLPAAVTVAVMPAGSTSCAGGTVTATPGSGTVAYTGGSVAAGAVCTVVVGVTSSTAGAHLNSSGALTSSLGSSGGANATLTVELALPAFSKTFMPDVVQAGTPSTLTLTIDNPVNAVAVGNLAFTDNLPAGLVVATPSNAVNGCGGTLTATPGSGVVSLSGGTVAGNGSCSVTVSVVAAASGSYANTTGDLTSDAGNSGPASATLSVLDPLSIAKAFLTAPVLPGGLVDLQFTISNPAARTSSNIAFTDDLGAVLPGMVAVGLPAANLCGAGSQVAGTSTIVLTGGTLAPGTSCTFTVSVQVPANASPGIYTNVTSSVTSTSTEGAIIGNFATDDIEVAFLDFAKSFLPDPVLAGSTTPLTFTIVNPDPANAATGITFTDDLDAVLAGLTAVGLPLNDVCGAGSQLSGTSVITLTGGNLGPGESCSFIVDVLVPSSAPDGMVTNVTSVLDATVGGNAVTGGFASVAVATLDIEGNVAAIPTLSTWGLLALALLLAAVAIRRLRVAGGVD